MLDIRDVREITTNAVEVKVADALRTVENEVTLAAKGGLYVCFINVDTAEIADICVERIYLAELGKKFEAKSVEHKTALNKWAVRISWSVGKR